MNKQKTALSAAASEALQARFAHRIAAALDECSRELPHDVSERLKSAREQALERARAVRRLAAAPSPLSVGGRALALGGPGGDRGSWWLRLGAVLPLIALVAGLVLIQRSQLSSQISAAAEIDTALLADDVPPAAYSDPGFLEFLKGPPN